MKMPNVTHIPPYTYYDGVHVKGKTMMFMDEWEKLRQYNIKLEDYICQCIVVLAQNNLAPPDAPEQVENVLREKFINAIKGER